MRNMQSMAHLLKILCGVGMIDEEHFNREMAMLLNYGGYLEQDSFNEARKFFLPRGWVHNMFFIWVISKIRTVLQPPCFNHNAGTFHSITKMVTLDDEALELDDEALELDEEALEALEKLSRLTEGVHFLNTWITLNSTLQDIGLAGDETLQKRLAARDGYAKLCIYERIFGRDMIKTVTDALEENPTFKICQEKADEIKSILNGNHIKTLSITDQEDIRTKIKFFEHDEHWYWNTYIHPVRRKLGEAAVETIETVCEYTIKDRCMNMHAGASAAPPKLLMLFIANGLHLIGSNSPCTAIEAQGGRFFLFRLVLGWNWMTV